MNTNPDSVIYKIPFSREKIFKKMSVPIALLFLVWITTQSIYNIFLGIPLAAVLIFFVMFFIRTLFKSFYSPAYIIQDQIVFDNTGFFTRKLSIEAFKVKSTLKLISEKDVSVVESIIGLMESSKKSKLFSKLSCCQ